MKVYSTFVSSGQKKRTVVWWQGSYLKENYLSTVKLCSWVDALTQISMNITTALASALHYTILLFWLAVFSLNYVSSIQGLETFNMAATQELLRKMLKAFIYIS